MTPGQLANRERLLQVRLEELLKVVRRREIVVFIDECVYTRRSIPDKTWNHPLLAKTVPKHKLTFKAISVLGGIDTEGNLVVCLVRDDSINVDDLVEMSSQLRRHYGRRKVNIFLDNLAIHRNHRFK